MEAPMPDEEIPAWKYLDIYLFSNGQENSPPRKYHLVSDHLDLWPDTLKELAQVQFGSPDTNISLYTTQGRLVNTPLELNHNKAYVAVRSPEVFIDAGYDRYLLKATRSWEKRQDKRCSITPEKQGEHLMSRKSDPESIGILKTIVPSTLDNLGSIIVKPRITTSSRPQDRAERNSFKRSSLSKRNETALSPVKSMKSPTQRRENNMHNDETADDSTPSKSPFRGRAPKVFQKRRNSEAIVSKVEEVVNQLENSSPRNVEQINAKTKRHENQSRLMTKPVENEKDLHTKPKTIPHFIGNRPRILTNKPVENEKDQQRAKLKPFSNSIENRHRIAIHSGENVKNEQNTPKITPHLNENQNDTKVIEPYFDAEQHIKEYNQTIGNIVSNNEDVINIGTPLNISNNKSNRQNFNNQLVPPVLPTEKKEKPRNKSSNDNKPESSFNNQNKINDDSLKKKETLSPPATSTMTNTLSDLSKGIINMRIEVWSSSDAKRNASCDIKAPVIILTNEIGSQVDMAGQTGQNKGLHQVIASDKDGIEGNYKVVLVRSSHPDNDASDSCEHSVIGEYVMFLPVIKLDQLYCRCSDGETKDINALDTNSSVANSVKKTPSCMSIHKENVNRMSLVTEILDEVIPKAAELNDKIQDNTEPSEKKLSTNDKQFEESTKTLETSPIKLVESERISKGHIVNRNSECTNLISKHEVPAEYTLDSKEDLQEKELSVSQPDYREPVDSEEPNPNPIKIVAPQLLQQTKESVTSKNSKFSESKVPEASDLEKETKMEESVEISHSQTGALNINASEVSSAHAKSAELSKFPSATPLVSKRTSIGAKSAELSKFPSATPLVSKRTSNGAKSAELSKFPSATPLVSKRTSIREAGESTKQSNNEKLSLASAVAEATSLLETKLDPGILVATQDKSTQTEWTDMLWEAKLHEDGHYTFHLPALSRLKEYNL